MKSFNIFLLLLGVINIGLAFFDANFHSVVGWLVAVLFTLKTALLERMLLNLYSLPKITKKRGK